MTLAFRALQDQLSALQLKVNQLERNAASGVRIDYAPNHTMSGTPHSPVGGATGWYIRINDLIVWGFVSAVGAGVGTGTMRLAAPFPLTTTGLIGVWKLDGSATAFGPIVVVAAGGADVEFHYPATWPSGADTVVTNTTPFALNTGDEISGIVVGRVYRQRVAP